MGRGRDGETRFGSTWNGGAGGSQRTGAAVMALKCVFAVHHAMLSLAPDDLMFFCVFEDSLPLTDVPVLPEHGASLRWLASVVW